MRLLLCFALAPLLTAADPYAAARERMVRDHIEARGVRDPGVLRSMRDTPRHLFVPPGARPQAYEDHPLPIGHGATISQPYIVAWMTELLRTEKTSRVLEIGTGSGYQAAVLSPLVKHVYTIEIVADLARSAEETLKRMSCQNVTVRHGDGYKGWPDQAPFDRILLTAAPPRVPQTLIDQLAPGGRLVAPVGGSPLTQELVVIEKRPDGSIQRRAVGGVVFVPMVTK